VVDGFAGSGTTLLVAERTGRIGCAIEIDPRYVDVDRHGPGAHKALESRGFRDANLVRNRYARGRAVPASDP
jgi:hypothetical protein